MLNRLYIIWKTTNERLNNALQMQKPCLAKKQRQIFWNERRCIESYRRVLNKCQGKVKEHHQHCEKYYHLIFNNKGTISRFCTICNKNMAHLDIKTVAIIRSITLFAVDQRCLTISFTSDHNWWGVYELSQATLQR